MLTAFTMDGPVVFIVAKTEIRRGSEIILDMSGFPPITDWNSIELETLAPNTTESNYNENEETLNLNAECEEIEEKSEDGKRVQSIYLVAKSNQSELAEWLKKINLLHVEPILRDLGARDLRFLKLLKEEDFQGTNVRLLEKRMLMQEIQKLNC